MSEHRRDFLKTATLIGAPALLRAQAQPLKVGLVGAGGRGTGAAAQALKADDLVQLHSVADIGIPQIDAALERLRRVAGDKVKVDDSRKFTGLDAYRKVIESGVDVVILATPPGFRPGHLRACIDAGKHVFCEKPVAVDAPGVRSVLATAELAKQKNLSLVSGFCWRRSNYIQETIGRVMDGAIGDVVAYYATYLTSPVKPMPAADTRPAGISDVEWMIRNWYNFTWLCGDGLVEQAVHSVDKVAWVMHDKMPASCVAVGGRQIPQPGGNIFDHIEVNYVWENGARAFLGQRQTVGCHNENADYILGTRGHCTIGRGPLPKIVSFGWGGQQSEWSFSGTKNDMYQEEHNVLFSAIRKGEPVNDGVWMSTSTMMAIMGRMAGYTGQQITYEQALNSQEQLFPDVVDWNGSMEVPPLAMPGTTKFV